MSIREFQEEIKKIRKKTVTSPSVLVNEVFRDLHFHSRPESYFYQSPSEFVIAMRIETWNRFLKLEEKFNHTITKTLWSTSDVIRNTDPTIIQNKDNLLDVISNVYKEFADHLFELNKSNTNSRRSRAGKELEEIFEKLLLMSNVRFDTQGSLAKKRFEQEGLSKIVDFVVPGVLEYQVSKRKCALISMKTSLRERWQEVPEELQRTGAQMMYLFTLDAKISADVMQNLHEHNIILVVPDPLKEKIYETNTSIIGLKTLLTELSELMKYWNDHQTAAILLKGDLDFFPQKITQFEQRLEKSILGTERQIIAAHLEKLKDLSNIE